MDREDASPSPNFQPARTFSHVSDINPRRGFHWLSLKLFNPNSVATQPNSAAGGCVRKWSPCSGLGIEFLGFKAVSLRLLR